MINRTNKVSNTQGVLSVSTTNGAIFNIDIQDAWVLKGRYWRVIKSGDNNKYIASLSMPRGRGKIDLLHRIIIGANHTIDIDHIDGDGFNNVRANLRVCSPSQNGGNRRKIKAASSIYKGLTKCGSSWCVRVKKNYKSIYVGVFKTESEAALAYNNAARKHFGEFARLNEVKL